MMNIFMYKEKAFTLAEILITLGIIGIVAALILPTVIANYQKKKAATQLKKSYTRLAEAIRLSELQNGDKEYWIYALNGENFFNTYLSKFMTIKKVTIKDSNLTYYLINGNPCTENYCTKLSYIGVLADGSSVIVSDTNYISNGKFVAIDINGLKGPNTCGKDYFPFAIHYKYGLIPFGYKDFGYGYQQFGDFDRNIITGNNIHACNKDQGGQWCGALIMMDGWEISRDYPW